MERANQLLPVRLPQTREFIVLYLLSKKVIKMVYSSWNNGLWAWRNWAREKRSCTKIVSFNDISWLDVFIGFGGQLDFNQGAAHCLDGQGKPVIACTSTTKEGCSRIVPMLQEGILEWKACHASEILSSVFSRHIYKFLSTFLNECTLILVPVCQNIELMREQYWVIY